MYVTAPNECYALDAGSGRQIWRYPGRARPGSRWAATRIAASGVAGDRVFMVTDHAHLIALNRWTGALVWDTEMADWHQNYSASSAPLPGRQSGHLGRVGRRARRERLRRRASIRRPAKKCGASGPCRSRASRGPKRGTARTSTTAARRRGSPAATIRSSISSTGRSVIRARNTTATIGRATISTRTACWRSIARAARSSGTSSSRRTISGIGTRRRRRCWSTRRGRASRASSCSTRAATGSSTCSIARTARCS